MLIVPTWRNMLVIRRKQLGLRQGDLGKLCDTVASGISQIETGRQNVTVKQLERIASALKCKLVIQFEPLEEPAEPSEPAAE
jgi:transcriptional regulator with XRE-family HTH domain